MTQEAKSPRQLAVDEWRRVDAMTGPGREMAKPYLRIALRPLRLASLMNPEEPNYTRAVGSARASITQARKIMENN